MAQAVEKATASDDRSLIFLAMFFGPPHPQLSLQVAAELLGVDCDSVSVVLREGLLRVVEYSWPESDPDAVEFHYWACRKLVNLFSSAAEDLLLQRIHMQPEPKKKCAIINALGTMCFVQCLGRLSLESVRVLIRLAEASGQPEAIRGASREALRNALLVNDRDRPVLSQELRREIQEAVDS